AGWSGEADAAGTFRLYDAACVIDDPIGARLGSRQRNGYGCRALGDVQLVGLPGAPDLDLKLRGRDIAIGGPAHRRSADGRRDVDATDRTGRAGVRCERELGAGRGD